MADTRFVVDYPPLKRHREELREQRRLRGRRLMVAVPAAVLSVAAAAAWSAPLAVMLAGVAAIVVFFLALPGSSSVDPGHLAGVEGEAAVLERLKSLPDDYLILNRVRLPDETLTNGQRELDFIVAGPTGLWVVEVKNTPGHLQVMPGRKHWPLARRAGCGSRPNWNAMANPVPQARAQVEALERWLLINGIEARARGVIVMAHPEIAITDARAAEMPVLVRDQLAEHLQAEPPRTLAPAALQRLGELRPA
ncbi:nuclease-related domain-containing protein [Wenzhouxiangella sediminis]|uniref:NERD domain-containing protein n=1 Tax=Wenzhouxiangella sediminis TaxID=1792836 RepID=A0A3E1K7K1_9GAMM|nr:nuclease-related domain-containing protein [Wenzhouxiangella sediminis]RFF29963.1 NERD domain-containing protein [Wenzhouxiangella sediminis]